MLHVGVFIPELPLTTGLVVPVVLSGTWVSSSVIFGGETSSFIAGDGVFLRLYLRRFVLTGALERNQSLSKQLKLQGLYTGGQ